MIRAILLSLAVTALDPSVFTTQTNYKRVKKAAEAKITLLAQPGWKFNSQYPLWLHAYKNKVHADNRMHGEVVYSTLSDNSGTELIFRVPVNQIRLTKDKLFVKINFSFCSKTTCKVWRGELFEFTKKDLK
tara:strand:- start:347 stop:739 length:393 start_codon:yes stop_codon:yes gene_type:complete